MSCHSERSEESTTMHACGRGIGFFAPLRMTVGILLGFILCSAAFAKGPALTEVKVFPADVNLKTRQDRQSLVVQATYADGVTRDVTARASYSIGNKALVKLDQSTLFPVADGKTELRVKFEGKTLTVPV